jgi:hypothetical protein
MSLSALGQGVCGRHGTGLFDPDRFDLTVCAESLLALVPVLVLLPWGLVDALELKKLQDRPRNGWRGSFLHKAKLVRPVLSHFSKSGGTN